MMKRVLEWVRGRRAATGCLVCGICCDYYAHALVASPGDLERWRAEGRQDLLSRVGPEGDLWIEPAGGGRLDICPFLKQVGSDRALCGIHETKPRVCAAYPTSHHGYRCLRGVCVLRRPTASSAL